MYFVHCWVRKTVGPQAPQQCLPGDWGGVQYTDRSRLGDVGSSIPTVDAKSCTTKRMVEALFDGINSDKPPFLTGAGFATVGMDPLWIPLGFLSFHRHPWPRRRCPSCRRTIDRTSSLRGLDTSCGEWMTMLSCLG